MLAVNLMSVDSIAPESSQTQSVKGSEEQGEFGRLFKQTAETNKLSSSADTKKPDAVSQQPRDEESESDELMQKNDDLWTSICYAAMNPAGLPQQQQTGVADEQPLEGAVSAATDGITDIDLTAQIAPPELSELPELAEPTALTEDAQSGQPSLTQMEKDLNAALEGRLDEPVEIISFTARYVNIKPAQETEPVQAPLQQADTLPEAEAEDSQTQPAAPQADAVQLPRQETQEAAQPKAVSTDLAADAPADVQPAPPEQSAEAPQTTQDTSFAESQLQPAATETLKPEQTAAAVQTAPAPEPKTAQQAKPTAPTAEAAEPQSAEPAIKLAGAQMQDTSGETDSFSGEKAGGEAVQAKKPAAASKEDGSAAFAAQLRQTGQPAPAEQAVPAEKAASVDRAMTQFAQELSQFDSGIKELQLQLEPENLGKLTITLSMTENGVSARILTGDQEIRGVIASQLNTLTQALKDDGVKLDSIDVMYQSAGEQLPNGQGGSQQQYSAPTAAMRLKTGSADEPETVEDAAAPLPAMDGYQLYDEEPSRNEYRA